MDRKIYCKLSEEKGRKVWIILKNQFDQSGDYLPLIKIALTAKQIDRYIVSDQCILGLFVCNLIKSSVNSYYTYKGTDIEIIDSYEKQNSNFGYQFYLKNNELTYLELLNALDSVKSSFRFQIQNEIKYPTIDDHGFYINNDDFEILVRNIKRGINTLILGSTGSGKSSIVQLLADQLNLQCKMYDMGAMHDPISDLLGVHRLENGKSVFDYARFVEDVQKPGIICLDELSRAPATSLNILFPVLDHRRTLSIEIAGCKDVREVKIHPECVFIATANIGLEYTGTSTLDKALTNRFFPIEFSYLPKDIEAKVLTKRCGISISDSELIANVANSIRKLYDSQEITISISTRETLMIGNLVADGWEIANAMKIILLPLYQKEERDRIIKLLMSK